VSVEVAFVKFLGSRQAWGSLALNKFILEVAVDQSEENTYKVLLAGKEVNFPPCIFGFCIAECS